MWKILLNVSFMFVFASGAALAGSDEASMGATSEPDLVSAQPDATLQNLVDREGLLLERTKHFAIYHNASALWAEQLGRLLEDSYDRFDACMDEIGLPRNDLHAPLVWICFQERSDFVAYARAADGIAPYSLEAYYSAMTNRVAFCCNSEKNIEGIGPTTLEPASEDQETGQSVPLATFESRDTIAKVTHEAVHHLGFSRGILRREVVYPMWITEGMAVNLEYSGIGDASRGEQWQGTLRKARDAGKLLSLRDFVTFTRVDFRDMGNARIRYAQAWGFYDFMSHRYPFQLREYLKALRTERTGQRFPTVESFERAFGSLDGMTRNWARYLEDQRP